MSWFFSFVRILGASQPATSMLVQLQAEMDSRKFDVRLKKLEDPIGTLCEGVGDITREIYTALQNAETLPIELATDFYEEFSRPLARLEAEGLIRGIHTIGGRFQGGLAIPDPSFILYMAAVHEDTAKMKKLHGIVDSCRRGSSLRVQEVMEETGLANPIVWAMFQAYEAIGYGLCSQETGLNPYYLGKA